MLEKQIVRSTPEAVVAAPMTGHGTQLKSERVQVDLQLLPGDGGVLRTLAGGGSVSLQGVTLRLAFDAAPAAAGTEEGEAPGSSGPVPSTGEEAGRVNAAHAR